MTPWTITCTLVAPVVLSTRTPLVGDALLSAAEALRHWGGTAMTRQPVAGSDWIDRLPLPVAEDCGHWACSLVTFHPPFVRMADRLYKTSDSRLTPPKDLGSGARKTAMVDLTTWSIPQISFDVDTTGEAQSASLADLVTRFFPRVTVGSLGRIGYGRIGKATLLPRDPAIRAVWDAQGQPRRPLRVTDLPPDWVRDPDKTVLLAMRAEPPRWYGPKEWCVVPHPHSWLPLNPDTRRPVYAD